MLLSLVHVGVRVFIHRLVPARQDFFVARVSSSQSSSAQAGRAFNADLQKTVAEDVRCRLIAAAPLAAEARAGAIENAATGNKRSDHRTATDLLLAAGVTSYRRPAAARPVPEEEQGVAALPRVDRGMCRQ